MQSSVNDAYHSVCDSTFNIPFEKLTRFDAETISVFPNEIPEFVERELVRLYGNLYSSIPQLSGNGKLQNASTYVVRKGGEAVTVFLFCIEKGKVTLLNEVIEIPQEQIAQFAKTIFSRFADVNVIAFKSIKTKLDRLKFPYQCVNYLEDIVVTLPSSVSEYMASLGKNTRRNIKRYAKKLETSFPSFSYQLLDDKDVTEEQIRAIIELNQARMAGKNKVSAITEADTERMIKLVRDCGLVCVAMIDGKVCAGAISFRIGQNYFLKVLAHDPQYDDYSLGLLCCFHTMCECIERGAKEFHFLWGRYDYKYTLRGCQRDLDYLVIYRSRLQLLLNAKTVLDTTIKGRARQFNLWVQDAKNSDHFIFKMAVRVRKLIRNLQQMTSRLPASRRS